MRHLQIIFILAAFALFSSCGGQMIFPSVEFDSCFMQYDKPDELKAQLTQLKESVDMEEPNSPVMAVIGCLHYQLKQPAVAKQWLKKSFAAAKENSSAKQTAASALGLIHLKEQEHQKITPYIMSAKEHYLGRWMLVLYYIDFYRKYDNSEYLESAIKYMQAKHQQEGETSATRRLLQQMNLIYSMEQLCRQAQGPDGISLTKQPLLPTAQKTAAANGQANKPGGQINNNKLDDSPAACSRPQLNEEKRYLFSTAWGFVSMLLKEPPFNNI